MTVDKSDLLFMAGALVAGGVAGWLAHDVGGHPEPTAFTEPPTTALFVAASASPAVAIKHVPNPARCDDSVGTAPDCPATAADDEGVCTAPDCPATAADDEGVCAKFVAKRCADFKSAFKPKVAQAAVACLRDLEGNAACDPARVNLCGHNALMAACPEAMPEPTQIAATGAAPGASISSACDSILRSCAGQPRPPTLAECRRTLTGMSDLGRASIVECMAKHCADEGLVGCEASQTR